MLFIALISQDHRSVDSVANLAQKAKQTVKCCLRCDLARVDVELNLVGREEVTDDHDVSDADAQHRIGFIANRERLRRFGFWKCIAYYVDEPRGPVRPQLIM